MTEQEAIEFCKNDPESAAKIILMVEVLEKKIKELLKTTEIKTHLQQSQQKFPFPAKSRLIFLALVLIEAYFE